MSNGETINDAVGPFSITIFITEEEPTECLPIIHSHFLK